MATLRQRKQQRARQRHEEEKARERRRRETEDLLAFINNPVLVQEAATRLRGGTGLPGESVGGD